MQVMRDLARLSELAHDYRAEPAQPAPPVIVFDTRFATEYDRNEAKRLLAETRRSDPTYKDPLQQKRRLLRSKSKNDALSNPLNWKFTSQEKADALDRVVQDCNSVGIAEALIDEEGIDVNVRRYEAPKEKGEYVPIDQSRWLEHVTERNAVNFVTLLASRATRQNAMDRALGIALARGYAEAARALLYFGADPNVHGHVFLSFVQTCNIEMLRMTLGAPQRVNSFWMDRALVDAVKARSYEVVALLLAHKADPNHDGSDSLSLAVQAQDLRIVAGLIVNAFTEILPENMEPAARKAVTIPDAKRKHEMLELLLCAGIPPHCASLGAELLTGDFELVKLLIDHGVSPDQNAAESVCAAVRKLDVKLFDQLLQRKISPENATRALECLPVHASETQCLRIVPKLVDHGADKQMLDQFLVQAAGKGLPDYAATLIGLGASIDYESAHAVRLSLQAGDLSLLEILLRGNASSDALGKALPFAMALRPIEKRRRAVFLLLRKGVSGAELHVALQASVSDPPNWKDERLIEELLKAGASVDFKNQNGNCVQLVTQAGDLQTLEKLCQRKTSALTLSEAVPMAIKAHLSKNTMLTEELLQILLKHGAQGIHVAQGLVLAVNRDQSLRVMELLLKNGADVNYCEGSAIEEALKAPGTSKLHLLCDSQDIEAKTAERLIRLVLKRQNLDLEKARTVVSACRSHVAILSQSLVDEVRDREGRHDVVELLLEFGAAVNFNNGEVLHQAVRLGNAELVGRLSSANADKDTLYRAMITALGKASGFRLTLVHKLLSTGMTGIGENEALVAECGERMCDLNEVNMLLDFGASTNFKGGLPLQTAILNRNIPLLTVLLEKMPHAKSLENALSSARQTMCTETEKLDIFGTILKSEAASQLDFSTAETRATLEDALLEAVDSGPSSHGLVSLLLEYLPSGDCLNESLLKAVSAPTEKQSVQTVQLLLDHGADSSGMSGEPFLQAAMRGGAEVMEMLAKTGPNLNIIAPRLIQSMKDDDQLIKALELCFKQANEMVVPLSDSILFDGLRHFPRSARLLMLLLENGCHADSKSKLQLEPEAEVEDVTILIYALRKHLPESIVHSILRCGRGVDAGYVTPRSKSSAIIEASKRGLSTVVEELIKLGADVSCKDARRHSPLFYASANGHVETVKVLARAGSPSNDGSLHAAAREAQPEIVSCLMAHGHDPDYPCKLHGGRLALEELCMNAEHGENGWEGRLRKTIELMIPSEPRSLRRGDGKSFLHAAFENEHPLAVTEVLVELPQVWRHLNDGTYDYEDSNGYIYSPTQYIQRLLPHHGDETRRQLLALFPRGQDRFYNPRGEQPIGAVGLPAEIAEAADRQTRARWEFQEEVKRRDALAAHENKLTWQNHELALQISKAQHDRTLAQVEERETQERRLEQQKHALRLAHQREMNADQHRSIAAEHRLRLEYQKDEATSRQATLAAERAAELEHQRKVVNQAEAADQTRARAEMKLIDYKEQAMIREHNRQVKLIAKQDESVQLRSKEMRSYVQATQNPANRLTYDVD